jgi:hypothetical protein
MSGIDKPIYLVSFRDEWVTPGETARGTIAAFGTREDAGRFAVEAAKQGGYDPDLYHVVEFTASGKIHEV